MSKIYLYIIDLDERGSFRAHVEDQETGNVVYEIREGDELKPGETSIFEDGFMKHKDDIGRLGSYLKDLDIIEQSAKLIKG